MRSARLAELATRAAAALAVAVQAWCAATTLTPARAVSCTLLDKRHVGATGVAALQRLIDEPLSHA